jgi:hypothetical protein
MTHQDDIVQVMLLDIRDDRVHIILVGNPDTLASGS